MPRNPKQTNDFESFLNECNTYVWEWYIPEQFVRFGIPSLNGLWINDKEKIFKLATVLERVHPDDIDKIFVRRTSPLYKSNKMFEIDLRLRLSSQGYEWYGFRGMTLRRDKFGRPTYVRGVAINIDQRIRAQRKLLSSKDYQMQCEKQKTEYCAGVMQEVSSFLRSLATNADSIIAANDPAGREERLFRLNSIKDQAFRILDLTDKFKKVLGDRDSEMEKEIKDLALWEHLAELQQVYSLKMPGVLKLYFSNLYDSSHVFINTKMFDVLIENVINSQMRNTTSGYLTMNYQMLDAGNFQLSIACTDSTAQRDIDSNLTESGLGLSVCRLVAERLWGILRVEQLDDKIIYEITLPTDARRMLNPHLADAPEQEEMIDEEYDVLTTPSSSLYTEASLSGRPMVLIGIPNEASIYQDQHLFKVSVATDTAELQAAFRNVNPDIVFIDNNLPGPISPIEAISIIHGLAPDTPIVVTADYASRTLHKQVRMKGARYLLNNPLSLRKVNLMIKKYLK